MKPAGWATPGHLIAAVALVMPILAVYGPAQIAALQAVAGLAAVLFLLPRGLPSDNLYRVAAGLFAALTLWAAASALWSVDPGESLFEAARLGLGAIGGLSLVALALGLDEEDRKRIGTCLVVGFGLGLALLALEVATEGELRHVLQIHLQDRNAPFIYSVAFNRTANVLALLAWPTALVLLNRGRPLAAVAAVAAAAVVISRLENTAPLVGLAVGLAILVFAWLRPLVVAWIVAALVAIGVLAAPLMPGTILAPSRVVEAFPTIPMPDFHRLKIWEFAAERIAEKPLFGWGMDSAREIPGGKDTISVTMPLPGNPQVTDMAQMPLHPHNVSLQWWLELGFPGALLGAGLLVVAFQAATRVAAGPALAMAATGAATLVLMVSYGAWQTWWLGTLWLLATTFAAQAPKRRAEGRAPLA